MPKITTEWQRFDALTAAQLYELLRFRQSIFVVEQSSPYPDLDGFDQAARHLLLRTDGALSGCLRLIRMPVRIGRVAVAAPQRYRGLGRRLMTEALGFCAKHFPGQEIVLAAQLHLVPFYQGLGFAQTSAPYDDFGVMHVEMRMRSAG